MGDRGQINLMFETGEKIMLYTHWGGRKLPETLRQALQRGKPRWNDPPYLARIIFSEMIKDDVEGETGFGIAPYEMGPDHDPIIVDLEKKTVDGLSYEEYTKS